MMKTSHGMAGFLLVLVVLLEGSENAAGWGSSYSHNVSGKRGSWSSRYRGVTYTGFSVNVPANCGSFTVETGSDAHDGSGNCNLYLKYGGWPTRTSYLKRSTRLGYREKVQVLNPAPGRYYIRLRAISNYRTCIKVTTAAFSWRTDLLNRINAARAQRSLVRLVNHSRLQQAAQAYANDMVAKNYYGGDAHVGSTAANWTMQLRVAATGYRARDVMEIIRRRRNQAANRTNVKAMFDKWMSDSDLRARLLASHIRHAGFGYANKAGLEYQTRWVVDFAQPQ